MIDPAATPRQRIAAALEQAGEAGLKVPELCTATGLDHKVVLYTLRNMKDAGQVSIAEGDEPYQRDRVWVLNPDWSPKTAGRPCADHTAEFDDSNQRLIETLSAKHPHGYENIRLRA